MSRFASYDGTVLACQRAGLGPPLVCLPGGPARNPVYFGDLGGLGGAAGRQLVMLHTRGTGDSAEPEDPLSYRCDQQVDDVEALRRHLGVERMDLLGHSAAGNMAILYAARYPERIRRLVLLTPGLRALGLMLAPGEEREAPLRQRSAEPWYDEALAAFRTAQAGRDSTANLLKYAPFFYGRWDDAAREHVLVGVEPRGAMIGTRFYADGAFCPEATRAGLAELDAPVLIYSGQLDFIPPPRLAARAAEMFPRAELAVHPRGGHFPWLDDPVWLAGTIARFLR
jgi:proline iminopeptidase